MVLFVNTPGYELLKIELGDDGCLTSYSLECSTVTRKIFELALAKFGSKLVDWNLAQLWDEDLVRVADSKHLYRTKVLLEELIQKSSSRWSLPYAGQTVCTCRQVAAEIIDQSVAAGARTVEQITAWTTACSSCTSCRFKLEEIIKNRNAISAEKFATNIKKSA